MRQEDLTRSDRAGAGLGPELSLRFHPMILPQRPNASRMTPTTPPPPRGEPGQVGRLHPHRRPPSAHPHRHLEQPLRPVPRAPPRPSPLDRILQPRRGVSRLPPTHRLDVARVHHRAQLLHILRATRLDDRVEEPVQVSFERGMAQSPTPSSARRSPPTPTCSTTPRAGSLRRTPSPATSGIRHTRFLAARLRPVA